MSMAVQKLLLKPSQLTFWKVLVLKRSSSIHSKPPKGKVGPLETIIGFLAFTTGLLIPAGYILKHLPEQRKH
ncbi:hypothetical protein XELAEV_18039561mg [Xenopus laevis]|uniref:Uncharacterized protein n=1 Tax=Xenopus laevis TaxID=8355 RepID=A0A974C819_XENLA|nr:hypothetical protein XELAEV_18039561mg [Xenopus laevis]